MPGMIDTPDPIKILDSVAEGAKISATRSMTAAEHMADGAKETFLQTSKGLLGIMEQNCNTAKVAATKVIGEATGAADGLRTQVKVGLDETVGKLRREVEKQILSF